jgi:hypothetical protein
MPSLVTFITIRLRPGLSVGNSYHALRLHSWNNSWKDIQPYDQPLGSRLHRQHIHCYLLPAYIYHLSFPFVSSYTQSSHLQVSQSFKMKYIATALAFVTAVSAHGYVTSATIGGKPYTFYQPYSDPYTNPKTQRVSRPIQGNGPVQDVTLADLQCGGYTEGGVSGSSPAALHAEAAAGTDVDLVWTLWPDSHVGPTVTYMAKCPDTGCNAWMPETQYVSTPHPSNSKLTFLQGRMVQSAGSWPYRHIRRLGRHTPHESRRIRKIHDPQVHHSRVLPRSPRDYRAAFRVYISWSAVLPRVPSVEGHWWGKRKAYGTCGVSWGV